MEKFLYHATLDENLASIQRQGLKPVKDTRLCHWGGSLAEKCLGKAYLSADPGFSIYYGRIIQQTRAEQDCSQARDNLDVCVPEVILLRVPRSRLTGFLRRDKQTQSDYYVQRTIPPGDIEYLHGEQCWKPLATQSRDIIEGIATGEWREEPQSRHFFAETDRRATEQKNLVRACERQRPRGEGP